MSGSAVLCRVPSGDCPKVMELPSVVTQTRERRNSRTLSALVHAQHLRARVRRHHPITRAPAAEMRDQPDSLARSRPRRMPERSEEARTDDTRNGLAPREVTSAGNRHEPIHPAVARRWAAFRAHSAPVSPPPPRASDRSIPRCWLGVKSGMPGTNKHRRDATRSLPL